MRHLNAQRGMTLLGGLFAIFLAVFFGTLLFKIGPLYLEHSKIKASLESLKAQPDLASHSREGIADLLHKRLDMNYVTSVLPQNIAITKHGSYIKVQVVYDRAAHLFGNIDVVTHFNDAIELGAEAAN